MRNLLNFLVKYNYWFLFILLEVTSFVLLFRFNRYQQSVFFTSANAVVGKLYEVTGGITAYFHLKETNEDLLDHNIRLEQRVAALEKELLNVRSDTAAFLFFCREAGLLSSLYTCRSVRYPFLSGRVPRRSRRYLSFCTYVRFRCRSTWQQPPRSLP